MRFEHIMMMSFGVKDFKVGSGVEEIVSASINSLFILGGETEDGHLVEAIKSLKSAEA